MGRDLADAGFSVCAPDLRGHGESQHPGDYRVEAYAEDVVASCPGPWELVVGHSLGGTVAVVIADRIPGFARSLLLVDPAIEFAPVLRDEARERLAGEAERPPSIDELLAANPRWAPEDARLKRSAVLATEPDVMRDSIDHNDPWLFGDLLAGLDVPTHVLGADPDHDALFGADLYERVRATKPDLTFEVVEGAGHSVFRDDPDVVVAAAVGTLGQVARR